MPKVRLSSGEDVTVVPRFCLRCTCGVQVVLGTFGPKDEPIAMHPLPQCKLFTESDLLTYVRTLRKLYEPN